MRPVAGLYINHIYTWLYVVSHHSICHTTSTAVTVLNKHFKSLKGTTFHADWIINILIVLQVNSVLTSTLFVGYIKLSMAHSERLLMVFL